MKSVIRSFAVIGLVLVLVHGGVAGGQAKRVQAGIIGREGVIPDHIANSAGLVHGGEFRDLILPLPSRNAGRVAPRWGTLESRVRDAYYGIEDDEYSYWGGNPILGDDGKYHCFVARWPEDSAKGHMEWPRSTVAHAVAADPIGPWTVLGEAYPNVNNGKGHNPEVRRLKDGRWSLWLNGGGVMVTEGPDINGTWRTLGRSKVSESWHRMNRANANPSLTNVRKDGSLVFCSRLGSIGIIPDGNPTSPIEGIMPAMYPAYSGGPEDPVIWKTGHQYHLIFNYWMLRLAVRLRSHDGVTWELDPGIAYTQLAETYSDGATVGWYKAERPKIVQDAHGRATHLSVAMIDVVKRDDKGNDDHSSKHITLPLVVEGLAEILDTKPITADTRQVRVRLLAEAGFNPIKHVDVSSLHFGDPKEVNYGRGMKANASQPDGKDLVVAFGGADSGITADSFTGKILGKRTDGSVYYAYPRLPGFVDDPAVLVASPFRQDVKDGKATICFTVKNFGLAKSRPATLRVGFQGKDEAEFEVKVPELEPYAHKAYRVDVAQPYGQKALDGQLQRRFQPKYHTQRVLHP